MGAFGCAPRKRKKQETLIPALRGGGRTLQQKATVKETGRVVPARLNLLNKHQRAGGCLDSAPTRSGREKNLLSLEEEAKTGLLPYRIFSNG